MCGKINWNPVADGSQYRTQNVPRQLAIARQVCHHFVQPRVGDLERSVEYFETRCAHWNSPSVQLEMMG
jgi:hypothetical protein